MQHKSILTALIVVAISTTSTAVTVSLEGEGTTIIASPGTTVVVNILSDAPLTPELGLDADVTITGDAIFTNAMDIVDCHIYGWDPVFSLPTQGLGSTEVELAFSSFNTVPPGVVGYVHIAHGSGPVTVSIAFGGNIGGIPERPRPDFSTGVVTIIPEPATLLLLAPATLILLRKRRH